MQRITTVARHSLKWAQPKAMKMFYQLLDGEEEVATLEFRSMFGTLATGQSADGTWTFKRTGVFHPVVTVRREGSDKDIAEFKNNTWKSGGTLTMPDGRTYLASTNFWATNFDISTESGEALISFKRIAGLLHLSMEMIVHGSAAHKPELPWMAMLGLYLIVMMQRDHAAAAAT
jgi:hypothetical protein